MAQSALTVTPPNPTPPTNMGSTGVTGPNPPNFTRQNYANMFNMDATGRPQSPYGVNPNPPPYYDDGAAGALITFAGNVAALAGGTTAADNAGASPGFIGTANAGAGGTGVNNAAGTYPVQGGLVPAASSVAHEGAGTETSFAQTYNTPQILVPIPLVMTGDGPALPAPTVGGGPPSPNQLHASSLSPATNPTLTTIAPTTSVHGTAAITMTATGVGFNRQSQIVIGGVKQATTFVSSTSLTCLATPPAAIPTPAAVPVTVVTGGVVGTAAQNWTIT